MANHEKAQWQALKWILRYIIGYLSTVMVYGGATSDNKTEIKGFVDSNYLGCMDTIKSLSRYVFTMLGITIS